MADKYTSQHTGLEIDNAVDIVVVVDTDLQSHINNVNNPHIVTKQQIFLGDVDNTSDINKPISTATQIALDAKADSVQTLNLTTRVTTAENNIAENTTDIAGIQQQITNEAHFRGYLQTNAEIQALNGTPNDYAYSAESQTIWIFQTATSWGNSLKPVPDQTVPKTTTVPLADGVGTIGDEAAYASGNHRHPTDISREPAFSKQSGFNQAFETVSTNIKMDGTASVGSSSTIPRADHIHPTDIGRAPVNHSATSGVYGASSASNYGHAKASSTIPKMDGGASVGIEAESFSRGDHVHPSDISKINVGGGAFSGQVTGTVIRATRLETNGSGSTYYEVYSPLNPPPSDPAPPKIIDLTAASWTGSTAPYVATILKDAHGKGNTPVIEIFDTNGNSVSTTTNINLSTGTITLYSNIRIALKAIIRT